VGVTQTLPSTRSVYSTHPSKPKMSASLAAFTPVVALRAPRQAPRRATSTVTHASTSPSESKTPLVDGRRAILGAAVSAAASFVLTPGRADAKDGKNGVYWISPKDGATVDKSFTIKMGVKGYELAPASEGLQEGTGHHHVVVDVPKGYVEKGEAIAFDATHLHYGKAQKEAVVELEPGKHTLTLQFANAKHESYGKKFAKTITVNVV